MSTATPNAYKYATIAFPVLTSGAYTFGQSSAPVDTVIYVYEGAFNPSNLSQNFLTGNDDIDGGILPLPTIPPGMTMGICNTARQCPVVTTGLSNGQTYTLIVSHYTSSDYLNFSLPLGIFVYGPGSVAFVQTGAQVLDSVTAMMNSPATGAARAIDTSSSLVALFAGAGLSGNRAISDAVTQTLPLLTGGSMVAASSALSGINRVIQARFEANRGMSSGNAFIGDRNVWAKPFGSWAEQSDRNGVAGFKADTAGLAIGADGAVNDNLRVGAAFAYAKANIDGSSSIAPHDADVDVYQLIGYGSYALDERTEVNFQVDVGQNQNKGKRTIAFTNTTASSSYDSQTAHVGVGLARSYPLNAKTTVTPSVRADYTWIKDDSYLEKGAGLLNLDVDSRSTEELILSLDGKISHQVDTQTSLSANLGVGYDTLSKRTSVTASFAGAPGVAFTTEGISPSPWLARGGAGLTHMTAGGTEITVRYDAEYRTDFLNQTASLKANWTF
ncbi:MAG: autotransporter outer membrane beta-barrel domain-containing protein [Azoarcus sp.]